MPATLLADLAQRFWEFQCREFPLTAIQAGAPTADDRLLLEAPEDHERRAAFAASMAAELDGVDAAALDVQQVATLQLLRRELDLLVRIVATGAHLRPTLYPLGPEFGLVYFANITGLSTVDDAARYVARIGTIGGALDGVRRALVAGQAAGMIYPRLVLERAADNVRGMAGTAPDASSFYDPFRRAPNRTPAFQALAERALAVIADTVQPAFRAYADYLETELTRTATDVLACTAGPQGHDQYRLLVQSFATVDDDPEEIHTIGLAEVERLTAEMQVVATEAGFAGDVQAFRRHLQGDNEMIAPSGEALREQIEILSKRIDARIPEFFGRTPRTTYGVRSIPEAIAEKMPPAYAQPNAADGTSAGVHWITSIPGKCPKYMHLPLALHEAWPGHLMHLALIQEMEHLPAFRRYGALRYSACLEGWALYCERLGEEMGFYDTPAKRYGRLEMEMWRACRLVVDTGLHWKGWGHAQAVEFMQANMALPETTVVAEVDRYVGLPAQAVSYQLGNLRFRRIRAAAEAALGERFRLRDFHDALMAAGPVTLTVLETLMGDWTERQKPLSA